MSRYFIIGGSGFIGSSFIEKIIQEDPEYLIFVYSRNEFSQFCLKNKLCNDAKVKFIIGDIKDFSSLNNYFSLTEPDYVIIASALSRSFFWISHFNLPLIPEGKCFGKTSGIKS